MAQPPKAADTGKSGSGDVSSGKSPSWWDEPTSARDFVPAPIMFLIVLAVTLALYNLFTFCIWNVFYGILWLLLALILTISSYLGGVEE